MNLTKEAEQKLEQITSSFSQSYMNNAKWEKVFTEIINNRDLIKKCEIYDLLYSGINEIKWPIVDEQQKHITQTYISQDYTTSEYPKTLYKTIVYIEFPKYWSNQAKETLVLEKRITQNTDKIKEKISKLGLFEWEEEEGYLRLMGYRK